MTKKDWLCPICNDIMWKFSPRYMLCPTGHGRLQPAWGLKDLLLASKVNSRTWFILGYDGEYQYVPHGHKAALEKAPQEGEVVASVAFRGRRAARLFRQKKSHQVRSHATAKSFPRIA